MTVLDQHGCSLGCTTMSDASYDTQFVIARQDVCYAISLEYTCTQTATFRLYISTILTAEGRVLPSRATSGDCTGTEAA